jgi:hypothetical protein
MKMTVYDPPGGWRYGFPKEYKPLPDEDLKDTLLRDGYPQEEIVNGGVEYCRFWEYNTQEGQKVNSKCVTFPKLDAVAEHFKGCLTLADIAEQVVPECPICGSKKLQCPNGHSWDID